MANQSYEPTLNNRKMQEGSDLYILEVSCESEHGMKHFESNVDPIKEIMDWESDEEYNFVSDEEDSERDYSIYISQYHFSTIEDRDTTIEILNFFKDYYMDAGKSTKNNFIIVTQEQYEKRKNTNPTI